MKRFNKSRNIWDESDRKMGILLLGMIIISFIVIAYACIMPDKPDERAIQIENSILAEEKSAESANIVDKNTKYIIREVIYDKDKYCINNGNLYTFKTFSDSEALDIYSRITNSNGYRLLQYNSEYRGFWDGRTKYTILFEKTF